MFRQCKSKRRTSSESACDGLALGADKNRPLTYNTTRREEAARALHQGRRRNRGRGISGALAISLLLAASTQVQADTIPISSTGTTSDPITLTEDRIYDFTGDYTYTLAGDIAGGSFSLSKSGPGTLILSGNNSYTGGTVLQQGTIQLGSNSALGQWTAADPGSSQEGMLLVTASDGVLQLNEDRTIQNHFQLGGRDGSNVPTDPDATLKISIAPGASLSISGVENTSTNTFLGVGGAITVNVPGKNSSTSPLSFSAGSLLLDSNTAAKGGAIGAHFTDAGQHAVLDFSGLDKVTFSNNTAGASGAGNGGAIYVYASGGSATVTLGDHATFSSNTAGASGASNGGAIYGSAGSIVTLGDHATFSSNTAGASGTGTSYGGAIYGAAGSFVTLGDYATFSNNVAGKGFSGNGGAIYSGTASLGAYATFINNTAGGGRQGGGGAISASALADPSLVSLQQGAYFKDNRAGVTGAVSNSFGGAISSSHDLHLAGHTFFDTNLVGSSTSSSTGGAIHLGGGGAGARENIALLDTGNSDPNAAIAFSDNRVNVTDFNTPDGDANSIHLTANTLLDLRGIGNIYFDDPISSGTTGNNSLRKSGEGFVQFVGSNVLNPSGGSNGEVTVSGGVFRVVSGASFTTQGTGATFTLASGATLAGGGSITAEQNFTISGTISPDADRFEIPTYVPKGDITNGASESHYNFFLNDKATTVDDSKKIGTLSFEGDVAFNNATLAIDLDASASQMADQISISGAVSGKATVDIRTWDDVSDANILSAGSGLDANNFELTFLGQSLTTSGDRQFSATLGGDNSKLTITTQSDPNDLLYWRGGTDEWNMRDKDWTRTQANSSGDVNFIPRDYVVFDVNESATVTLAGSGQLVSGMRISAGNYTFIGGEIIAMPHSEAGIYPDFDGKVDISGAGTRAYINNTLSAVSIKVANGALLGGRGQIKGPLHIESGATLAPGDASAMATLKVSGPVTFADGSTYVVRITERNADSLAVDGSLSIAGGATLKVSNGAGAGVIWKTGTSYDIITSENGTISNTFSKLDASDLPFLRVSQQLASDQKTLSLITSYNGDDPGPGPHPLDNATFNQENTNQGVASLPPGHDGQNFVGNMPGDTGLWALDMLSGEGYRSFNTMLWEHFRNQHVFTLSHLSANTLNAELRKIRAGQGLRSFAEGAGEDSSAINNNLWLEASGFHASFDGDRNAADSRLYGPELRIGYDLRSEEGWIAGVSARAGLLKAEVEDRHTDADVDSFGLTVYGGKEISFDSGVLRLALGAGYGYDDVDAERFIWGAGIDQRLQGDYDAHAWQVFGEAAYLFRLTDSLLMEPFVNLSWDEYRSESFTESGGSLALHVDAQTESHATSNLGLRAYLLARDELSMSFELGWVHTYGSLDDAGVHAFRDGSDSFGIRGVGASRDAARIGLGLNVELTPELRLNMAYDGLIGDDSDSHGGFARLIYHW